MDRMGMDIDVELLIRLVEGQPCIWDKTLHEYKSRACTSAAWRAVCEQLDPRFDEYANSEKAVYAKRVLNKWRNVKDQWLKRCRQVASEKKTGKRPVKHYYYHDQLSFLLKCTDAHEADDDDGSRSPTATVFNYAPEIAPRASKRRAATLADTEAADGKKKKAGERFPYTPITLDEDPMVMFFKGILPSMRDFTEEETLEFQSGVLNMVQNIKRSRAYQTAPGPSQQPTTAFPIRSSQRLANIVKQDVSESFG